jgi:hypothetical protein
VSSKPQPLAFDGSPNADVVRISLVLRTSYALLTYSVDDAYYVYATTNPTLGLEGGERKVVQKVHIGIE